MHKNPLLEMLYRLGTLPLLLLVRMVVHMLREELTHYFLRLLDHLGMTDDLSGGPIGTQELYDRSHWIRAATGGILVSQVEIGQKVNEGQELATVTDPLSSREHRIVSPYAGRIIGMAFDQLVMPGFATFNVATREAPPGDTPGLGLDPEPGFEPAFEDTELDERPE